MKPAPPLSVEPRRSRVLIATIVLGHAATLALVSSLSLPRWMMLGLIAGIVAAAAVAVWKIVGPAAPARLAVGLDRRVAVTAHDGRTRRGDILADSYVGAHCTTIVWRPDGARCACTLLVATDSLPADDRRRLRVALRYGRAVAREPPASGVDAG
jgi:hypothetical protein